jgi:hypothetical protein
MRLTIPNIDLVLTKNPLLQSTRDLVGRFNGLPVLPRPPAVDTARLDLLHQIARAAGTYLTSKPPQPNGKNANRWQGLKNLLEQIGPLVAACGGKLVNGPADFQAINNNAHSYWLEALDPRHRPGYSLSPMFQVWRMNPDAIAKKQSFWDYMGDGSTFSNVAYLGDVARKRYQVDFDGKGMMEQTEDGDPFSTERHHTEFSGSGWGIFVVSPTGDIYSGSHVLGKLHHSSFLEGRPVMAAGEIVVHDGAVKAITAKSGHYRPTADNMMQFVRQFGTLPWNAVIRPNMLDVNNGGKAVFHFLGDFRERGPAAAARLTRDQVLAAVPTWAKGPEAMKSFQLVA